MRWIVSEIQKIADFFKMAPPNGDWPKWIFSKLKMLSATRTMTYHNYLEINFLWNCCIHYPASEVHHTLLETFFSISRIAMWTPSFFQERGLETVQVVKEDKVCCKKKDNCSIFQKKSESPQFKIWTRPILYRTL